MRTPHESFAVEQDDTFRGIEYSHDLRCFLLNAPFAVTGLHVLQLFDFDWHGMPDARDEIFGKRGQMRIPCFTEPNQTNFHSKTSDAGAIHETVNELEAG